MILRALFLAWGDLLRPRIFGVVALGIGLTILLFVALQAGAFWAIRNFAPETLSLPWIGAVPVAPALSWSSLLLFPLMSIFLMVPVAAGFSGLFAERVSEAVEEIHYNLYGKALESVKAGKDIPARKLYVCPVCGNTEYDEAPGKCPVCGVAAARFMEIA